MEWKIYVESMKAELDPNAALLNQHSQEWAKVNDQRTVARGQDKRVIHKQEEGQIQEKTKKGLLRNAQYVTQANNTSQ